MTKKNCECGAGKEQGTCEACRREEIFTYWCKTCNRSVSEKRCPYCGLKAQRKGPAQPG